MASKKKSRKKSSRSTKKTPKINPDDVGVSKEEADAIIAEHGEGRLVGCIAASFATRKLSSGS